jgi:hypothetical protein
MASVCHRAQASCRTPKATTASASAAAAAATTSGSTKPGDGFSNANDCPGLSYAQIG